MQGLVTLDFGNTNPHAGIFQKNLEKWQLVKVTPLEELQIYLNQLGMNASNTSIVLCEVKAREEKLWPLLEQGFLLTRLKDYWRGVKFAGMPVQYATTLGQDRLIAAYYAYKHEQIPTLIIDAGTYVTMDVVNEMGLRGGYIIPGLKAYYSSFQFGEQLKQISLDLKMTDEIPTETDLAMGQSYLAFVALAKKLINDYQIKRIIISGGQMNLWDQFFDREEQALVVERHPHLLHWALQYWFTTQIEPL